MPSPLFVFRRAPGRACLSLALVASVVSVAGCGGITCPEPLAEVDGFCEMVDPSTTIPDGGPNPDPKPFDERCDGIDNDGDDAVDESWPELGQPCGETRGECAPGAYVCAADGLGVVCTGGVGPLAELCDGKDNDCDGTIDNGPAETCDGRDNDCNGLVDEGVWSVKREPFDDHTSVAAIDGGFVVTRLVADRVRIETYDIGGNRTAQHDDLQNPISDTVFLESDVSGGRLLVALGKHRFAVLEARIDDALVPIISGVHMLHDDWDQGIDWGIYTPPYNPRVVASPGRFVGHRDLITFALSPFDGDLAALRIAPTAARGVPPEAYFDVAGSFVVWEQSDNVRAGWLLDDGAFLAEIDVSRGDNPTIGLRSGGPGVAFLKDGRVTLSELGGVTLQCREGGYCNATIDADPIAAQATTAMGLAFDETSDTWVIAAGEQLLVVGRRDGEPVVKQAEQSSLSAQSPRRIDVAMSGGTAAVVQSAESGESILTFLGCL